ncbi:DUF1294 domain-containing protein [Novosphingobium sp.]|uniref:DUF1294 domain-containing protein n=1 Tax=Novosphingobium sp. TaxID=1874826 RepID=UPI0025DE1561|nr:DUF1294 domain-containing protein [Novosphingobium sp.]
MSPEAPAALTALTPWIALIGPAELFAGFAAINTVTFAMFGIDKARAANGQWRVQESTLLGLALLGGSIGAWAGRRAFRHKTRKQPFGRRLVTISAVQVLAVAGLAGWWLGG